MPDLPSFQRDYPLIAAMAADGLAVVSTDLFEADPRWVVDADDVADLDAAAFRRVVEI